MVTFLFTLHFLARYLHIVCATALVGGTLFYEMVVPVAIDELRPEQQLIVFARARWVFKWIVWAAAVMIILSGIVYTTEHWKQYASDQYNRPELPPGMTTTMPREIPPGSRPGWWWVAHISTGTIAVLIALSLTTGPVPPARPIRWMRLNLMLLLLVMFLGSTARQARISELQRPPNPQPAPESAPQ
ncbi:MAG: hypothetical protein ABSF29_11445 [Tepidisphaeraceae bacterium]|jgi:hypothetical protein